MSTTTVRLDPEEEETLDRLAEVHGGRSGALRAGLRLLAAKTARQAALAELLAEWEAEDGPVDRAAVDRMIDEYGL